MARELNTTKLNANMGRAENEEYRNSYIYTFIISKYNNRQYISTFYEDLIDGAKQA